MILGHKVLGKGKKHVLVMHDWFSDCTSYDDLLPYLDMESFTFVFADLRGYGRSIEKVGEFSLEEASHDLLALVEELHWKEFYIVGHSMTGLVAQKIVARSQKRVKGAICITPTPASGSPAPDDVLAFLEDAAKSNDEAASQVVQMMTGQRHSAPFIQYKIKRWRETSTADARVGYLHMFVKSDISKEIEGIKTSFLIIIGEHDAEGHNEKAMKETFGKWYPNCRFEVVKNAGHYPMQETPVYLATLLHNFLSSV